MNSVDPGRQLLVVTFAVAGRTGLVGSTLGIVDKTVLAASPLRAYFADSVNDFFPLAGWTWGSFVFSHIFLLLREWRLEQPVAHYCDSSSSR